MKGNDFNIPFYVLIAEPITSYVINNEVIGFEKFISLSLLKGGNDFFTN